MKRAAWCASVPTLPTFSIVGAAKSGTTSLSYYLSQHPDIYIPPNKEPQWFSRIPHVRGLGSHPDDSEDEYLKPFEGRTTVSPHPKGESDTEPPAQGPPTTVHASQIGDARSRTLVS